MKIEQEEVIIPEQREVRLKYIADDGKCFNSEKTCREYEARMEIENNPIFKSRIEVKTVSGASAILFYITAASDIQWLRDNGCITKNNFTVNDWPTNGEGWYLYWQIYNSEKHVAFSYFRHIHSYMRSIEEKYREWGDMITMAIFNKTEEMKADNGTE